jgi:ATP-dependent Zn protease
MIWYLVIAIHNVTVFDYCFHGFVWTSVRIKQETAISVFNPREDMVDQGYTPFGYLKMQMVVAHGGRCAEHVIFGENITDGGRDDLEKITKVNTMAP